MTIKKLTAEQQKKVQEILRVYHEDVFNIVDKYHKKIKAILEDMDKKKMDELQKLIGSKQL